MPNARFRAYLSIDCRSTIYDLSKYKEVLNQIWSRGCGGCNPFGIYRLFYLKVLKCHLIQEIIHVSVFLYQYIILLASLIYFWRGGSRDPKDPPWIRPWALVNISTIGQIRIIYITRPYATSRFNL